MPDTHQNHDGGEYKPATGFLTSMLSAGADPLLKAEGEILLGIETAMSDWLRRRHEAVLEARNLLTRLNASADPAEQMRAQQEWLAGAFRRLTDDATAWQAATQQIMTRAWSWVPEGLATGAETATEAPRAAERTITKPLRMAAKGE